MQKEQQSNRSLPLKTSSQHCLVQMQHEELDRDVPQDQRVDVVLAHVHTCLEILEHSVEDRAVRLANRPQVEAPHLSHVLILVVWSHPL